MNSLLTGQLGLTDKAEDAEPLLRLSSAIPLESALKQLLRSEACSDEAFFDYELAQALRGLTHAVKSPQAVPLSTTIGVTRRAALVNAEDTDDSTCTAASRVGSVRMKGSDLALWRLSVACLDSASGATTAIYLSTRLLCDGASVYGEGNDRPCCTREWTSALLALAEQRVWGSASAAAMTTVLPSGSWSVAEDGKAAATILARACVDRSLQLGFLVLLSGTLRLVACDSVPGKRLLLDYPALVQGTLHALLPSVALLAGGTEPEMSMAVSQEPNPLPPRLRVEANHFIVHAFYWVALDTLASHEALRDANQPQKEQRTAPRMLDREIPLLLWPQLSLFRNALARCLGWMHDDAVRQTHTEAAATSEKSPPTNQTVVALVHTVFSAVLREQERLAQARLSAARQYGDTAKDYHMLSDAMWLSTLRLCVVLRDVAGAFVAVHGGLLVASTSDHVVLRTDRDVLLHIATCVLRVPALEKTETETDVLSATSALLSAAVCVAAAAPVLRLQASLWGADVAVTRQIHAALVQRPLHYHDETVLKLASLLSSSIVYSLAPSSTSIASSIAADSSEQLLDMLAESRDAASQCAVDMLIRAVTERPHSLLPSLFRLLHHGSAQARRNTLDVLAGLPTHCASNSDAPAATTTATKYRETLRVLAENLLLHLQDEELCLRLQSAALFEKVWPEDVLRPLLTLSMTRDATGRKQAASTRALASVMAAHTDNADVVLLLLQEASQLMDDAVEVAADSGTVATSHTSGAVRNEDGSVVAVAPTESSDAAAETELPPNSRSRHAYTTPADILSHTLLYSTDTLTSQVRDEQEEEEGAAAATETPKGTMRAKLRERVTAVTLQCELVWARHVVNWSARAHLDPLLLFLQTSSREEEEQRTVIDAPGALNAQRNAQAPTMNNIVSAAAASSSSGDRLGFLWKSVTGLISGISSPSFQGDSTVVAAALLQAICEVFFAHAETPSERDDDDDENVTALNDSPWLAQVQAWSATETAPHDPIRNSLDAQRRAATNEVLAPLLCLRACHSDTVFASLAVHPTPDAERDDNETQNPHHPHRARLRRLWHTLWVALTDAPYRAGFDTVREAQRVLLEVLTHFPASAFFSTLLQEVTAAHSAKEDGLFLARVFTFGFCSYLSRAESSCVAAAVAQRSELDSVTERFVLPWLLDRTEGSTTVTAVDKSQLQRLSLSVVDAYALLETVNLDDAPSKTAAPRADSESPGQAESQDAHWIAGSILHTLAQQYRQITGAVNTVTDEQTTAGHVTSESTHTLLAKFQLCLLVQRRLLDLLQHQAAVPEHGGHGRSAEVRYLAWCGRSIPCLIELANSAASAASVPSSSLREQMGLQGEAEAVAVQCTELLFFAVMASRRVGASVRPDVTSTSAAPTAHTPLQKLCFADKQALVQFAVGTTRYHKSSAVQQSGVKLLSALFGVAPELFAEVGDGGDKRNQLGPLEEGTQALYSVSLMHPDPQTRRTAEQVLQLLTSATARSEL